MPPARPFYLSAVILVAVAAADLARAEDITPEKVIHEVRSGQERLAKLEEMLASWQCEQTVTSNGQKPGTTRTVVKRHGQGVLGELNQGTLCKGDDCIFVVKMNKSSGKWTLQKYQRVDVENGWRQLIEREYFIYHPLLALRREYTTADFLTDPLFLPSAARRIGPDRVELDYDHQLPNDTGGKTKIRGTLTFATNMDWLVVKSVSRAADTPLGFPMDSSLVREVQLRDGKPQVYRTQFDFVNGNTREVINGREYSYKYFPPESINPEEFKLAYYQIQPPADDVYEDRPGFNWPLWGGIGLACIALSVFLTWLVRRKRRQA